tara:strand:+ start:906 stop:1661 length:756 start_codon:yes stop_codon:yes gene_type:complete
MVSLARRATYLRRRGPRRPWRSLGRLALRVVRGGALAGSAFILASVILVDIAGLVGVPPSILMGQRALAGENIRRDAVPLTRISPHLVNAVIGAEDSRFCTHDGFDTEAIREALENLRSGGRRRGASTISQQTAKNIFLWNGGGWMRKGMEVWFTALIETSWPKRRIIEAYLNIAEWGDGIFGAEAAAQARFGVSAADLTPRQAALLAAVLPNPNEWRVDPPGNYVAGRASTLEARAGVVRREGFAACVSG